QDAPGLVLECRSSLLSVADRRVLPTLRVCTVAIGSRRSCDLVGAASLLWCTAAAGNGQAVERRFCDNSGRLAVVAAGWKEYEIALFEGKAITETGEKKADDEAFVLVNGIAGAVLEVGSRWMRHNAGRAARRDEGRLHRNIRRRIAMLSPFNRKPKAPVEAEPVAPDQQRAATISPSYSS